MYEGSVSKAIIPYQDPWVLISQGFKPDDFSVSQLANEILTVGSSGRGRARIQRSVSVIDSRRLVKAIRRLKNLGLGSSAIKNLLKVGTFSLFASQAAGRGNCIGGGINDDCGSYSLIPLLAIAPIAIFGAFFMFYCCLPTPIVGIQPHDDDIV